LQHHLKILFVLIASALPWLSALAQLPDDDVVAMMKANYLYQFSNNNNWPAESKKGKFYVGILGNNGVYSVMLEKYGAKPIGSQTLEVLSLTEVPSNQPLHVLYVDKSRKADMPKILKEFKDKPTLIVTSWDGALVQGGQINFKMDNGFLRYQLDRAAMENRKITPGLKIIQWAVQ
jgi:hypothetical protein